jgi:hypothetical protein
VTNLSWLELQYNNISDIEPLVNNPGLSQGDRIYLQGNLLDSDSVKMHIPELEVRGVTIYYYS